MDDAPPFVATEAVLLFPVSQSPVDQVKGISTVGRVLVRTSFSPSSPSSTRKSNYFLSICPKRPKIEPQALHPNIATMRASSIFAPVIFVAGFAAAQDLNSLAGIANSLASEITAPEADTSAILASATSQYSDLAGQASSLASQYGVTDTSQLNSIIASATSNIPGATGLSSIISQASAGATSAASAASSGASSVGGAASSVGGAASSRVTGAVSSGSSAAAAADSTGAADVNAVGLGALAAGLMGVAAVL